jgi:hypothetical protein
VMFLDPVTWWVRTIISIHRSFFNDCILFDVFILVMISNTERGKLGV